MMCPPLRRTDIHRTNETAQCSRMHAASLRLGACPPRHRATLGARQGHSRPCWKAPFTLPLTVQKIGAKREPAFTFSASRRQLAPTVNLMQLCVAYCPLQATFIPHLFWLATKCPHPHSSSLFLPSFLFQVRANLVPRYHSLPVLCFCCLLRQCIYVFFFSRTASLTCASALEEQGLVQRSCC